MTRGVAKKTLLLLARDNSSSIGGAEKVGERCLSSLFDEAGPGAEFPCLFPGKSVTQEESMHSEREILCR